MLQPERWDALAWGAVVLPMGLLICVYMAQYDGIYLLSAQQAGSRQPRFVTDITEIRCA